MTKLSLDGGSEKLPRYSVIRQDVNVKILFTYAQIDFMNSFMNSCIKTLCNILRFIENREGAKKLSPHLELG